MDSLRDWGYARDYVECMWLMLQSDTPDDYVIATGVQHSVREFTSLAFRFNGIDLEKFYYDEEVRNSWRKKLGLQDKFIIGEGIDEKGIDKKTGRTLVAVSPAFFRPTDVVNLLGDPSKARNKLRWDPNKTSFEELVRLMCVNDRKKAEEELRIKNALNNMGKL